MSTNGTALAQSAQAMTKPTDGWLSVEDLAAQVAMIQQAMRAVMREGEHYGIVPGTSRKDEKGKELSKPSLFKPGAEKLCFLFRLDPEFEIVSQEETDTTISYKIRCVLLHIPTGNRVATGMGSCSSRESKYGLRNAQRACPKCGKATIFTSKKDGEGYYCWRKKDGCGATFPPGDSAIESQQTGKVPVDNVWDQGNTILKMACKRAHVAAVLSGTAASDIFTQDLEDLVEAGVIDVSYTAPVKASPQPKRAEPPHDPVTGEVREAPAEASLPQQQRIYVLGRKVISADKAAVQDWIEAQLGRPLAKLPTGERTIKGVSKADASKLIERLELLEESAELAS